MTTERELREQERNSKQIYGEELTPHPSKGGVWIVVAVIAVIVVGVLFL